MGYFCNRRRQRGFTLIELVMALGISGIALAGAWQMSSSATHAIQGRLIGQQALTVAAAARNYVTANRSALLAALPNVDDAGELLISDIQDAGYLPQSFNNENPYGQTFRIFLKREDAGSPGADDADNLLTLAVSDGGAAISDTVANKAVSSMGAAGGFIFSDDATTARGAFGGWHTTRQCWITARIDS